MAGSNPYPGHEGRHGNSSLYLELGGSVWSPGYGDDGQGDSIHIRDMENSARTIGSGYQHHNIVSSSIEWNRGETSQGVEEFLEMCHEQPDRLGESAAMGASGNEECS